MLIFIIDAMMFSKLLVYLIFNQKKIQKINSDFLKIRQIKFND